MNDPLMDAYLELGMTQVIPSIADYARAWRDLGDLFAINGRPSSAANCYSRAAFYERETEGEYIRLIEGSFSELLEA